MGLIAHQRIANKGLQDLDRHEQQRGRDDEDAGAMRLLDNVIEKLVQFGEDQVDLAQSAKPVHRCEATAARPCGDGTARSDSRRAR